MYMQGQEDRLVDTSNETFAREHLTNVPSLNIQMIPGRGHLIAFDEKDRIIKTIVRMIDTCQRRELTISILLTIPILSKLFFKIL